MKKIKDSCVGIDMSKASSATVERLVPLIAAVRKPAHFGANALEQAFLADGKVDAFVDIRDRMRVVDFAAGYLIAKEAGAVMSDPQGGPVNTKISLDEKFNVVASATPVLHERILKILNPSQQPSESSRTPLTLLRARPRAARQPVRGSSRTAPPPPARPSGRSACPRRRPSRPSAKPTLSRAIPSCATLSRESSRVRQRPWKNLPMPSLSIIMEAALGPCMVTSDSFVREDREERASLAPSLRPAASTASTSYLSITSSMGRSSSGFLDVTT